MLNKHFMIKLFKRHFITFTLCTGLSVCVQAQKTTILIQNPISIERPSELIVLKRSALEVRLGKISKHKFIQITTKNNRPIVVQHDDLNGDGLWDEIAFLQTFSGNEQKEINLTVSEHPATIKAQVLANVRHRRKNKDNTFGDNLLEDSVLGTQLPTDFSKQPLPPFLTEGPAWENDKVGFRIYFDSRNAKDIWGKTTPQMILNEVGLDTANNYHKQADWGMDVLKVGKSLGAGSLALAVPQADGSTKLVRLGGGNFKKVRYQQMANGPVRAICRLTYSDWKISTTSKLVQVQEDISIWGGQYFYQSTISLKNVPTKAQLVTGIVNLHTQKPYQFIESTKALTLYSFDKQSENNDNLGMAITVSKSLSPTLGISPNTDADILNTFTISMKIPSYERPSFRFYAAWQASDTRFQQEASFADFMKDENSRFSNPLKVKYLSR